MRSLPVLSRRPTTSPSRSESPVPKTSRTLRQRFWLAGSVVFTPPTHPVPLDNGMQWWSYVKGANWRHPQDPPSDNSATVPMRIQMFAVWIGIGAGRERFSAGNQRPLVDHRVLAAGAPSYQRFSSRGQHLQHDNGGPFHLLQVPPSQGLAAEDLFEHASHQAAYDKRRDDRVHDPVHVPWNNQRAVISQRIEAFADALLHLHRFHGHVLAVKTKLLNHGRVRGPWWQDCHMHAERLPFHMKGLGEALNIRLCTRVVRHVGDSFIRAHCSHEQESAPSAPDELLAEMISDVQMCERVEPQQFSHLVSVIGEEFAGFARASIGNHKSDVEIVGEGGEVLEKALPGEIETGDPI